MLTAPAVVAVLVVATGALTQPAPEPPPSGDGWGSVSCSETPSPACDLGAGSGGTPAPEPDADSTTSDDPGPRGGRADEAAQPVDGVRCSYVISDFRPPGDGLVPASFGTPSRGPAAVVVVPAATRREQQPEPGEDGAWYLWRCSGDGFRDSLYRAPVWIPDGEPVPGTEGPSAADLAEQARERLRLPDPAVAASPVGDQLVNLPTWLWLDGEWAPVEATASVPGVSVTARAVPESATWSMGDGSEVVCQGAGTPYAPGIDPASPSPDCGHTYRTSSAGRPGEMFTVSVTVSWTVTWSGAGDGGTFPGLTTTSEAGFRVAESQALVTGGG